MAQRFRRLSLFIVMFALIGVFLPSAVHAEDAQPGDGQAGDQPPPASLASTINSAYVWFGVEYNLTTIWLRICSDAPNFQLRSERPGYWMTEIFNRTNKSNGCSPATTYGWRMVYLASPGMQFNIYATASETWYSEAAFMERASRTTCTVTGLGTGYCTPSANLTAISAPRGYIDSPGHGSTVSGIITVRGWAIDIGTWSGTGVDAVRVSYGNTLLGTASYGGARGDVASAYGDSRYTYSGWSMEINTASLPVGIGTLNIDYHSTVNGSWTRMQRQINIAPTIMPTYAISGYVRTSSGAPLAGVTVAIGTRSAITDGNGYYAFSGVPAGNYTLTPTLNGYSFNPGNRTVTVNG
ncbi:carboxypeptidase regulatory-like domain-containing protein, partial [Roseiflexus sp.]